MKELIVGKDTVLVDDEDFEFVRKLPWRVLKKGYVVATVYLHRLVMNAPPDKTVDHKNEVKLDNQKSNLEVKTMKENLYATICRGRNPRTPKHGKRKKSLFVGVSPARSKWKATCAGKYLGSYDDEREAARAYNKAAVARYGSGAFVNNL